MGNVYISPPPFVIAAAMASKRLQHYQAKSIILPFLLHKPSVILSISPMNADCRSELVKWEQQQIFMVVLSVYLYVSIENLYGMKWNGNRNIKSRSKREAIQFSSHTDSF